MHTSMKKWIDKNNLKKTRNHAAGSYQVAADINGNINISATIKPESAALIMDIAATLYNAAQESIRVTNNANQYRQAAIIEEKKAIEDNQKQDRIALSVYRRTKSRKLAASMYDWMDKTHIMMLVNAADKEQKRLYLSARNDNMLKLNIKQGISIRNIAKRYDLHHSTVAAIIKREAVKSQPALF